MPRYEVRSKIPGKDTWKIEQVFDNFEQAKAFFETRKDLFMDRDWTIKKVMSEAKQLIKKSRVKRDNLNL